MGIIDFFRQPDINVDIAHYYNTPGSLLMDVRTPQEYREGHIHGSTYIPLQSIDKVEFVAENKDTAIYVYCRSGSCSRQTVNFLRYIGHGNVTNIGGITAYTRKLAY